MNAQVLQGKQALVFGGGSGIGLACARLLARDGADVMIASRDEGRLRTAAESFGGTWAVCDATDEDSVRETVARLPRIDICVHCVGGSTVTPLLLCDAETFRADIERNLVSTFFAIRHVGAAMVRGGGGSFVAISSDAAKLSFPFVGPYCAAKAGVEALIRVAADELGAKGVRFNAVRPGMTPTERNKHIVDDEELYRFFTEQKPLGRLGVPDDIAGAVRFLAGPESSWMTGQSFAIDGGNELRRAPWMEGAARAKHGDAAVDAAFQGEID